MLCRLLTLNVTTKDSGLSMYTSAAQRGGNGKFAWRMEGSARGSRHQAHCYCYIVRQICACFAPSCCWSLSCCREAAAAGTYTSARNGIRRRRNRNRVAQRTNSQVDLLGSLIVGFASGSTADWDVLNLTAPRTRPDTRLVQMFLLACSNVVGPLVRHESVCEPVQCPYVSADSSHVNADSSLKYLSQHRDHCAHAARTHVAHVSNRSMIGAEPHVTHCSLRLNDCN
jgi:hypothetical protein